MADITSMFGDTSTPDATPVIDIVLATWFANEITTDLSGFASVRFVIEGTQSASNPMVAKLLKGVDLPAGFLVTSDDLGGHAELLPKLGTRLELAIRPSTTTAPAGES